MNTFKPQVSTARRTRRAQRGIALIEAMVGIMIFAFGVLGMVGLQASMTRAQTASKFRADASNLANELVGLMWSDAPANQLRYASAACPSYPRCQEWLDKVGKLLPSGASTVKVTLVSPATATSQIYEAEVSVSWAQPGEQGTSYSRLLARVEP